MLTLRLFARRLALGCIAASTVCGPALADDISGSMQGAGVERFSPVSSTWAAVITREPVDTAVAARDSAWTAVVATSHEPARGPTLARKPAEPSIAGPGLTGTGHALSGLASYYWQEQMTATGERFDKTAMTAAHKTLPLGTRVRVIRVDTGNSVIVRINDRGPFRPGRIIDLSQGAAQRLDMMSAGLASVKLEVLGK